MDSSEDQVAEIRCDCPLGAAARLARRNADLTRELHRATIRHSGLVAEVRLLQCWQDDARKEINSMRNERDALSRWYSEVLDQRDASRRDAARLAEKLARVAAAVDG